MVVFRRTVPLNDKSCGNMAQTYLAQQQQKRTKQGSAAWRGAPVDFVPATITVACSRCPVGKAPVLTLDAEVLRHKQLQLCNDMQCSAFRRKYALLGSEWNKGNFSCEPWRCRCEIRAPRSQVAQNGNHICLGNTSQQVLSYVCYVLCV